MLNLPFESDPSFHLVWRTVNMFEAYTGTPRMKHTYRVERDGLKAQVKGGKVFPANFHIFQGEFGFQSATQRGVLETKRFIDMLKYAGAKPSLEKSDDGLGFCFWFDLSTRTRKAYYEIANTIWHGDTRWMQGVAYTFSALVLGKKLNPEIVARIKALDEALYAAARICQVPRCVPERRKEVNG